MDLVILFIKLSVDLRLEIEQKIDTSERVVRYLKQHDDVPREVLALAILGFETKD